MPEIIAAIIAHLLRLLLPAAIDAATPTIEQGAATPDLRDRLRDSVRRAGWLLCVVLACSGCATRGIIIPPGEPVRLRQDIRAKVWIRDESGKPVPGTIKGRAGWYLLPDPAEVAP